MGDELFNEIDVQLESGGMFTVRARAGDVEPIYLGWCRTGQDLPEWLIEMTEDEAQDVVNALARLLKLGRSVRRQTGEMPRGADGRFV